MPDASGSEIELTASLGGTQKSSAFVVEADEYASLEHATTGLESKDGIWRTQEVRQESVSASVDDR